MNKAIPLLVGFAVFMAYSCCKPPPDYTPSEAAIYFNSFESSEDLDNFEGYASLSDDTPNKGGDSSLVISGGSIVPHLYLELGPFDEAMDLSLALWGKSGEDGRTGSIFMYLADDPEQIINIEIDHDEWAHYTSEEVLIVPVNQKIRVEFISGGFMPVTTYYDLLEIIDN